MSISESKQPKSASYFESVYHVSDSPLHAGGAGEIEFDLSIPIMRDEEVAIEGLRLEG